jgi:hypothetical protein
VCIDSLQYHYRKGNIKKEEANKENGSQVQKGKNKAKEGISTYDCGGAIHIKFSTKRDAINVVYKHNPIHRDVESRLITEQIGDRYVRSILLALFCRASSLVWFLSECHSNLRCV